MEQNCRLGVFQGRNDFGYAGFGGACPPKEINTSLPVSMGSKTEKIPVDSNSSGALLVTMLNANKNQRMTLR